MAVIPASDFDLRALPDAFYADPYPAYAALPPVARLPDGAVFLRRHADVEAVYRDTARFSSDKRVEFLPKYGFGALLEHHTTSLVFNDPPLHTRVRALIQGALLPRTIADIAPGLTALVDRLLDRLAERSTPDLIADFAAAIPVEVIGNLLGVPHDERGPLRGWSLAILGALEPALTPAQHAEGEAAVIAFAAYLGTLVERRRANPGDPARDVLTRLIQGAPALSRAELLHNCIFLLNAGHETTTNLIGNALVALHGWPDQRARLLADPGLIRTTVEEALRFESPNQLGNRRVVVEAEIGGFTLPPGTLLTLGIGAANRDPARFAAPDRLDIGRDPNRHLAFASGPHQCAGMAVARMEGRIAIGRFVARFPGYRIEHAARGHRARFRGFTRIAARLG